MSHSQTKKTNQQLPSVNRHALLFGLFSVFLIGISFSIINPIMPFLVAPYVHNPENQAVVIAALTSIHAVCMFLATPVLGTLSDRYGRRPLLLISLFGAAIGFTVFGVGGSLFILFIGRIIEGLTGGTISTIFAYFADITPNNERTKYFGWISAFSGAGVVMGPSLGGLIAGHFGNSAPLFFGAAITLLNVVYGFFFMPESLPKEQRLTAIPITRLNPFSQLIRILSMKNLNHLLFAGFLLWLPSGSLQAVLSQYGVDTFHFKPAIIGLVFSIMGIQDVLSQGLIMPQLLRRLHDKQIALLGIGAEMLGYTLIAASGFLSSILLFILGMFIFGFGDSIFGPSFNGMLSKTTAATEQGRVQGGSQSLQALARILGPLLGGQLYVLLHPAPALMGVLLLIAAAFVLRKFSKHSVA